jgi:hypothetical protein
MLLYEILDTLKSTSLNNFIHKSGNIIVNTGIRELEIPSFIGHNKV